MSEAAVRRTSAGGATTLPTRADAIIRDAYAVAVQPTRRNVLHWGAWAVALATELVLLVALRDGHVYGWEQSLTRRLQDVPGKQVIFDVSSTVTNTFSVPFALIFLAIVSVVLMLKHPWVAVVVLLSFPLHVLAQFPKALIERPRPSPAFAGIEGVGGFESFPSGHAEYAVTFYGFLAYVVVLHLASPWMRATAIVGWGLLVLATGFSRVAAGRHWPIDIFASYIIGLGLLSGLIWLYSALRSALQQRAEGVSFTRALPDRDRIGP